MKAIAALHHSSSLHKIEIQYVRRAIVQREDKFTTAVGPPFPGLPINDELILHRVVVDL